MAKNLPTQVPTPTTTPASSSLLYIVDAPYTVPVDNATTIANAVTKGHGLGNGYAKVAAGVLAVQSTLTETDLTTSDITTNDVSTSKHGFTPKAPNDTAKFLRGDATWAVPAAGSSTPRATVDFIFNTDTTSAGTRQQSLNSGTGATTLVSGGYTYSTGATSGSVSRGLLNNTILKVPFFDKNPAIFFGAMALAAEGGDYDLVLYCGGSGGPPATTTSVHFGFRFNRTSGVDTIFATNANGITETSTDITALVSAATTQKSLYAVMTSGTNIKYYYDGTLVATHTTNLPSANPTLVASQWGIINNAAATSTFQIGSVSLSFDLS